MLTGESKFQVGEEIIRLKTGNTPLVQQNVAHTFVKNTENEGCLVVMHQPVGTMEEYCQIARQLPDQQPKVHKRLAENREMQVLSPSLRPDK